MKSGVVFYMQGVKIAFLIPVFVRSLRKVFDGAIGCVLGDRVNPIIGSILRHEGVVVVDEITKPPFVGKEKADVWSCKAWHHRGDYPFDANLYFDLDVVFNSFDLSIFDLIQKHGMVVHTTGLPLRNDNYWAKFLNDKLATNIKTVCGCNGGMCGAIKNSPKAFEWSERVLKLYEAKFWNPDEYALNSMLAEGKAVAVGVEWMRPIKRGRMNRGACHVWHCQQRTHWGCRRWISEFRECHGTDYLGLRSRPDLYQLSEQEKGLLA